MINRVGHVLPLKDCAQLREGAQRLQIARPRRQILPDLNMGRRVEAAKASEPGALGPDVRNFQERLSRQLVLQTSRPLLRIGRPRVLVHAEVTWKAGGGCFQKTILEGEYGLKAVRFVELVVDAIAQ